MWNFFEMSVLGLSYGSFELWGSLGVLMIIIQLTVVETMWSSFSPYLNWSIAERDYDGTSEEV